MFPWKDVLMGQIRKIQKHEEKGDRSGKFKKTRRKEWRKEKEQIFIVCGGSHTHVFFIVPEHALRLPPLCNPSSGEPTCIRTSPTKNNNNSDRCMEQSHLSGFCFSSPVLVCNLKPF
jgi:hypothetical protein